MENIKNTTLNISPINHSYEGPRYGNNSESKPRRYKIKSRKAYEREIDEENKKVTINSLVVGLTALGSIICFSSMIAPSIEISERIGMFLLGMVSSKGITSSVKTLTESISRKAKLEDAYNINYKIDEYTRGENRGRSL